MSCPICYLSITKIAPCLGVETLLSITFNLYSCKKCGMLYECKKCNKYELGAISAIAHGIWCNNNTEKFFYGTSIPLGSVNGKFVYIDTIYVFREIPYIFLLRIDYEAAVRKAVLDMDVALLAQHTAIHTGERVENIIRLIKKSTPSCPFCGLYYETFPSEAVVAQHRCAGSVGTNKVRSLLAEST